MSMMTTLKLSRYSRPYTKISLSVGMSWGNGLNKYVSVVLIVLGWQWNVLVVWLVCPHLVFFVKLRVVVMFQNFLIFLRRMGKNVFAYRWYAHVENFVKFWWWDLLFACWWYTHVKKIMKFIWRAFLANFYSLVCTVVYLYLV